MEQQKLSVTVITCNEEENIRACLQSVAWADEIVVVDSGSIDSTIDICREFTDKVFVNPWEGMKEQKNHAVGRASNLWIFSIDADERVTTEMKEFILREMEHPSHDGYRFRRKNFFLGKWLKHGGWYPDHVLRLFRKDRSSFEGVNPHDKVVVRTGHVLTTPFHLEHLTYKSISQYVAKQNLYSGISASEKFRLGKVKEVGIAGIIGRTLWKFAETYLLKAGILDGYYGFVTAIGATYSTFWKYVKIKELARRDAAEGGKDLMS